MNRINRDYCSRNHHPKGWKAWTCKYEGGCGKFQGIYCTNCGAEITRMVNQAWPATERRPRTVIKSYVTSKGRKQTFCYAIPKWP